MAEALAIQTALYLAKVAGAHLYVVHLSSRQGLEVVRNARRQGLRFTVETTTPYLGIASDDPEWFPGEDGTAGAHQGPSRCALAGRARGLHQYGRHRQHVACRATKKPEAGLHGARPGLPALGTHLPALLHYGRCAASRSRLLVDRATRAPAKVYGIYPQKGTIAVGSDADLAIVDLDLERVVRAEELQGMSDFSPFEGKRLRGWPVATVKAGEIVARDGKIVGRPTGRYLLREAKPAAPDLEWLRRAA